MEKLEEIVREYINEGDWLSPEMDTVLEQMKFENEGVTYDYKNLYSNSAGFEAHVKIRKGKNRVDVFIEGSDMGHFVQSVETKA